MRIFSAIVFAIIIMLSFESCKKNTIANCGCNSPTIQTVQSIRGTLYLDKSLKEYYILSGTPGLQSKLYICDSSFSQLQAIVKTSPDHVNSSYWVIFSGDLKNYCPSDTVIYLDFMRNIQLTAIEKY